MKKILFIGLILIGLFLVLTPSVIQLIQPSEHWDRGFSMDTDTSSCFPGELQVGFFNTASYDNAWQMLQDAGTPDYSSGYGVFQYLATIPITKETYDDFSSFVGPETMVGKWLYENRNSGVIVDTYLFPEKLGRYDSNGNLIETIQGSGEPRWTVRFKEGVSQDEIRNLLSEVNLSPSIIEYTGSQTWYIKVPVGKEDYFIEIFDKNSQVEYAKKRACIRPL